MTAAPVRILLIDDSDIFLDIMSQAIESSDRAVLAGVARNGEEGIAQTKALQPDVISMDVHMPVMDGLEAIEASVFEDNTQTRPKRALLRVAHLSADAPAVDIAVDDSKPKDALVKGAAYKDASGYLPLKAAEYDLDVRNPGKRGVIADLAPVEVAKGTNYTAYAIGSPADGTFQVVVLVDAPA